MLTFQDMGAQLKELLQQLVGLKDESKTLAKDARDFDDQVESGLTMNELRAMIEKT